MPDTAPQAPAAPPFEKVRLGVIGCGAISGAYFGMAKNFPAVEVVACADLDLAAARAKAREFGVPKACSVDDLLADPAVELVVNLTVPRAHVPVALRCVEAGKHTYSEKPLGVNRQEGEHLLAAAARKNLKVGCAPDTFLGAGLQTARKLIDDGAVGRPLAFTAFMMGRGHESWHPSPEFYYEPGGGPMFDMGPYYLTALLNLLGPIKRVTGAAAVAIPERTITHKDKQTGTPGPKFGQKIKVQTPDHVCGTVEFANGCCGVIVQSFATMFPDYDAKQPIVIYGEEGTLKVPDPNGFDGPVHLRRAGDADWREAPPAFVKGYGRSVGCADLAYAIRTGRPHRAGAGQALTVLDVMQGFLDSAASGKAHEPTTDYHRPAPMPAHLPFGTLDS